MIKRRFLLLLVFLCTIFLPITSTAQQDTIRSYPYFNGFEDLSSLDSWSNEGAFDWNIDQTTSHSYNGAPSIGSLFTDGMVNTSGTQEQRLAVIVSPVFDFDKTVPGMLSFDYRIEPNHLLSENGTLYLQLKINTNGWITLGTWSNKSNGWQKAEFDLNFSLRHLFVQGNIQIRFLAQYECCSWNTNVDFNIDNLVLQDGVPAAYSDRNIDLIEALPGTGSGPSYNSYVASNLFDDNYHSIWLETDDDATLTYTFPTEVFIDSIYLQGADREFSPEYVRIEFYNSANERVFRSIHDDVYWGYRDNEISSFDTDADQSVSRVQLRVENSSYGDQLRLREIDFIGRLKAIQPNVSILSDNTGQFRYDNSILEYTNGSSKAWLILPNDQSRVLLTVNQFDLRNGQDVLSFYDGANNRATLIGKYDTSSPPPTYISSSSGMLYIEYVTFEGFSTSSGSGFSASFRTQTSAESTYPWTQVNDTSFVLDGRLGINTPFVSDEFDLLVNGGLVADELVIESLADAPDYVFEDGYDLKTLEEVKDYIKDHGHLPEVPSAKEFEESGMSLGEMNLLLLKKIEELTLHMIRQQAEIDSLKRRRP